MKMRLGYKIHQSNRFFYDIAGAEQWLEFPFDMLIFNVLYILTVGKTTSMNRIKT
ncbi:hypothetical protein [Leptospira mayottensis]|uniref:Uncharacterized protein n=1 Tax=Leptospira mayottensis 200901122 TaxID=1193010 RepID=A0AA87MSG5_9LEPT|nr:hypothetical protein [Leptospira mayottensis]EKS00961.1 hypothetical protein LEP1GSC125_3762 [Leptospira mayottensis 200901122]